MLCLVRTRPDKTVIFEQDMDRIGTSRQRTPDDQVARGSPQKPWLWYDAAFPGVHLE